MRWLIQSLDAPKPTGEQSRCLVSLTSLSADDVEEAVKAIRETTTTAAPASIQGPSSRSAARPTR